jgi:hypothetical protein
LSVFFFKFDLTEVCQAVLLLLICANIHGPCLISCSFFLTVIIVKASKNSIPGTRASALYFHVKWRPPVFFCRTLLMTASLIER